jgi:transposase
MAYFLKKTMNNKGLYLQIYESYYNPEKRQTAHRAIRALGYEHELRESGIADPIDHFKAEVVSMNRERKVLRNEEALRKISRETPERLLGYFPLKALNDFLGVRKDLDLLQMAGSFRFSLCDLLFLLTYARAAMPTSKSKTFHDVLPKLALPPHFSLDQLYDGVAFFGEEYEKVIEIYNHRVSSLYPYDTATVYFDCTNFYFEIDREDDFRKKGPSKEKRSDPIVGLGLLLDANQIPIGMKIFCGNESERPVMRDCIEALKKRNGVKGRTVRVADKGLNCGDNVASAILDGDGYIFSKSVKQLPALERAWAIRKDDDWADSVDAKGNLHYRHKSCIAEFTYQVTDENGKKRSVDIEEKRVVIFSPKLARKQIAEINRQVEKARKLRLAHAKRSEYGDSAKYITFTAVDNDGCISDDQVVATLNHKAIDKARSLAGYNMLVTSEKHMSDSQLYSTYHNLWRIEESFKVMKSQLEARPVYLQKRQTITGHFLICYIAELLLRLFQFKVLGNEFSSEEIMEMIRGLRVVEVSERKYVNISKSSALLDTLEKLTGLPLNNYHLTKGQVREIIECKL